MEVRLYPDIGTCASIREKGTWQVLRLVFITNQVNTSQHVLRDLTILAMALRISTSVPARQ